jgi:hypothetical protein
MLLLPVTLVLAIAGIAAYAATREGAMSAAAVDARYEYEAARYLAEAGVKLVTWQNAQRNCATPAFEPVQMGGGTIGVEGAVSKVIVSSSSSSSSTTTTGGGKGGGGGGSGGGETVTGSGLAFTSVATFRGATYRIERRGSTLMPFYNASLRPLPVTSVRAMDGDDTYIMQGETQGQHSRTYLEVSDAAGANAHGLIKFVMPAVPFGTKILQADLELTLDSVLVSRLPRSLSVHRVTRAWADSTTWDSTLWSTPGGDYLATPAAVREIAGINTRYAFPMLGLVEDWIKNPALNYGVLLKPVGMTTARFAASDGTGSRPFLVASYHPACT